MKEIREVEQQFKEGKKTDLSRLWMEKTTSGETEETEDGKAQEGRSRLLKEAAWPCEETV